MLHVDRMATTAASMNTFGTGKDSKQVVDKVKMNYASAKAANDNNADTGLAAAIHEKAGKQQSITHMLAQMNESYNANRYIVGALGSERRRMDALDGQAKLDLYRLHKYQLDVLYKTRLYRFWTGVAEFTLLVTLLLIAPIALWRGGRLSSRGLAVTEAVGVVLYALVMVALFQRLAMRRTTNWQHMYWRPNEVVRSATDKAGGGADA